MGHEVGVYEEMGQSKNRVRALINFFADRSGEGLFTVKNFGEAMQAQQIVQFTAEELTHLPDGPGARAFWLPPPSYGWLPYGIPKWQKPWPKPVVCSSD